VDFTPINDDVVLAGLTVDPDSTEGKAVEPHMRLLARRGHALFLEVIGEKLQAWQKNS
jgi:hypothetical protein